MKVYLNRISTALFALGVAGGLAFGGSQALSSPAYQPDCTGPDVLGECPPYTTQDCNRDCQDIGAVEGECGEGDCCRCKF